MTAGTNVAKAAIDIRLAKGGGAFKVPGAEVWVVVTCLVDCVFTSLRQGASDSGLCG